MMPRKPTSAFTLFEVIIAVLLISMIAVTVQRFVGATMTGIEVSQDRQRETETMTALFRYVDTQLDELPIRGQQLIQGFPHKFGEFNTDELQWRCTSGQGTLTGAAEGEWFVTLMVMPQAPNSRVQDLGLRRKPVNGADDKQMNWIPLIRDVAAIKFEYFDARLNAWIDRWNDPNAKPLLVRMQVWKTKESVPEIGVFTINSSMAQQ
ncbi:MAG TPA: type II secretion system protein [Chthoniobacteraceae bacterium]|nr:type II secretion system protein [Chthoniobacteraceae bacterium]